MAINWRKKMSVGNSIIDDQHRYLICLMNTIELTLNIDQHKDILKTTIDHLVEYTEYHFKQEERIQYKMNFHNAYEHKQQHQNIMAEVRDIKARIDTLITTESSNETPSDSDQAITDDELDQLLEKEQTKDELNLVELTTLMRHWVLDHVLKEDLTMRPYLKKLPPTFS